MKIIVPARRRSGRSERTCSTAAGDSSSARLAWNMLRLGGLALCVSRCAPPLPDFEDPVHGQPTLPDGSIGSKSGPISQMDAGVGASGTSLTDASSDAAAAEQRSCPMGACTPDAAVDAGRRRKTDTPCAAQLSAQLWDIWQGHPDFGQASIDTATLGIVEAALGTDGTPQFRQGAEGAPLLPYEWFHDVQDVNVSIATTFDMTRASDGLLSFESLSFYPVDGKGFATDASSVAHNTSFTSHFRGRFTYGGPEFVSITASDDTWLFVNGALAVDLGGVHAPQTGFVSLRERSQDLGLKIGRTYTLDIFHAQRGAAPSRSLFALQTNAQCLSTVP